MKIDLNDNLQAFASTPGESRRIAGIVLPGLPKSLSDDSRYSSLPARPDRVLEGFLRAVSEGRASNHTAC